MDRVVVVWFILTMFSFTTVYANEVKALIALKNSLHDPNGVLDSWHENMVAACPWTYVDCDNNNSVTSINLANSGLSGTLVPDLGNLTNLRNLEMFGNQISGTIPKELAKLPSLVALDLSTNNLTGPIPAGQGYWRSLTMMWLQNNNLCGRIPDKALAKIPVVNISTNNQLCGDKTHPPCPKNIKCP